MTIKSSHRPIVFLFLLCFFTGFCFAVDFISANQSLYGNQTLVSAGGNFELGIFSPGKSSRFYIGIWYDLKRVSTQTVVWVANRETPLVDKDSAQLKVLDGNLVLLDGSGNKIWSTDLNSSAFGDSLIAVLLDEGNLVLRDGLTSSTVWESFLNPTDTWLPGGRLGYNKRTKKNQLLTSWKNSEDPAPGLFSLELVPETKEYISRWNRTQEYWTSGAWNDHIFTRVPEMNLNYLFSFSFTENDNESYFTYSVINNSIISRFIMETSGQIKQQSWIANSDWSPFWSKPSQQCDVYTYCGPFSSCTPNASPSCDCLKGYVYKSATDWDLKDYSSGCVRETRLQCENNGTSRGKKDKFLMANYVKLPDHPQLFTARSISECKSYCLSNCSCTAYAFDETGCSFWNGELLNLLQLGKNDSSAKAIYIKLAASSSLFSKKDNKVAIGAIVGSIAAVIVILVVLFSVVMRQRWKKIGASKILDPSLVAFGYKDLQTATKNFSHKLGGGGFGSVFKGSLPDSSDIAVKKLESVSQGEKQFRTEVSTIGTIQHVNLVRLRGFCSEGSKRLLVYDYMENRSLDCHLFSKKEDSTVLDWRIRYQIALGIARGLAYLHEKCRDCIIHCDIKPENVLLDAEFCPKVADFGLAKLLGRDFSRVLTTMRGTRGYLAPEWLSGVPITVKADVYSYGMLLFELVSGRRNSEQRSKDERTIFFPSMAANVITEEGDALSLLDPLLSRKADANEVLKVIKIGCWCIQEDENIRPLISQVVQILEGVMDIETPPIPRSIEVMIENEEDIVFFTESSSSAQSSTTKSAITSISADESKKS